jgi:7,8-dihydroneopterin aldolase/epimerase/oxygenase
MMRIYQVRLEDVRLFGYHGLFPEERVLGNWFVLNLAISKRITQAFEDDINRTVDYGQLYTVCVEIMREPVDLLETLCERIAARCKELHPDYVELEIRIGKEHPPMGMMGGRSSVVWKENSEMNI